MKTIHLKTKLLVLLALLPAAAGYAAGTANHFDSPEDCGDAAKFATVTKAAGAGCLKTQGPSLSFGQTFKEPLASGVLTIWVYDDYAEIIDTWKWHHVNYGFTRMLDGKKTSVGCEIRRYFDGWRADLADPTQEFRYFPLPDAPRHAGWTRFDLVKPAGQQPATIYIDGHKAFTTPGSYDAVTSVGTDFLPYVDELSTDTDPASFRPNPIAAILPDNPYGRVLLRAGDKLNVNLALDPAGARSKEGKVSLRLLDGRGETLVSDDATIAWDKQGPQSVKFALPTPPRSGNFWLETSYQEPGGPVDFTRRKVNLQFTTPSFAAAELAPLEIFRRQWDFLPVGKNEPDVSKARAAAATPEDLATPATVPSDWSKAAKLRGAWADLDGYFNIGYTCHAAWYRQQVEIPSAWRGQKIMLEVDGPRDVATVFADGKVAGTVKWPGGDLDLSAFARIGKPLDLAIHVAASGPQRGLCGDITLYPSPRGPRLDGVAVRPSVAKHELAVTLELSGLEPGKTYKLKAAADNAGGSALVIPGTSFTATADTAVVELSAPWANPVLWELNAPYLYDFDAALLDANGKPLATLWPERFGFREISAKGPDLTLNGRPVTLFGYSGAIAAAPEHSRWCEKFGFASFYMGDGKEDARLLDESGKTREGERVQNVGGRLEEMLKSGKDNDPAAWAEIAHILEYQNKARRNHPGVFFQHGVLGGNRARNGSMYNPLFQDGNWVNLPPASDTLLVRSFKLGHRVLDKLHQLDPTRPATAQDSGSINDTMHITEYAGFQPIQEFIERSEYWRAFGTKPFLVSEQAAPMGPNWNDGLCLGFNGSGLPCIAEWTSFFCGDVAFERTELDETFLANQEKAVAQQRKKIADTVKNPLERDVALAKVRMAGDRTTYYEKDETLPNRLWKDRIRDEVFHWRANHLAMLAFFFSNGGPRLDLCYQEYQAPLTGFLAGTRDKLASKTHIFAPGETLERGALLLNNSHLPGELSCQWKLELGGETVASGSKTAAVAPGGQTFVPISIPIPAGPDRSGKLGVTILKDGKELRSDSCDIDVVVPRPFANQGGIALVDPEGDSAKALAAAGIKFQRRTFDADFGPFDTVIFGRRAFNYEIQLLAEGLDLGKLAAQGKRVLIMEQDEAALRNRFKLRTEYLSPRDVFGRGGSPLLLDGLPDRRLSNWRGAATLTDGYEVARNKAKPTLPGEFSDGGTWNYLWNDGAIHPRPIKWGNTHNVATVTAIKPDTGNFRALVDCGYDNNCAAAWELEAGKSRIVFNQLDVCGRTESDPAAIRYLQNLVRHVQTAPAPALRQAAYLGGERGAALLKALDVSVREIASPAEAGLDILVLGDATPEQLKGWKDGLAAFAAAGGTVFSLPKSEADFAANWTPFAVTAKMATVNHTVVGKPSAPLLAGLGNSDFYWKGNVPVVTIEKAEGAAVLLPTGVLADIPHGKGHYVLCQVEPSLFGDINLDYWLKDSARNTERLVRTLLANAGVAMAPPKLLALPNASLQLDHTFDLAGDWTFCPAQADATSCPAPSDPAWRGVKLPGRPSTLGRKGTFWLHKDFELPFEPSVSDSFLLRVGRISGADTLYVNGVKVAWTGLDTDPNAVTTVTRSYTLLSKFFRKGTNEVALLVDYDFNGGLGMAGGTGEVTAPLALELYKPRGGDKMPAPIDLASTYEWMGLPVTDPTAPCPSLHHTWKTLPWRRAAVPGYLQTQQPEWSGLTGYFWYWRQFTLKEALPETAEPVLVMGAVDDEDTTYFNGVKIGHTGKDTNPKDYWQAPRRYPIPKNLFKQGPNANLIQVQQNDFNGSGGICKGPVQIIFEDPEKTVRRKLAESPYLHDVGPVDDPYWHHGF